MQIFLMYQFFFFQGGPGGSSTGFGNFMEIGPLDVNLKPRDTTWLKLASLLFIDNPVGTGFRLESQLLTSIPPLSCPIFKDKRRSHR